MSGNTLSENAFSSVETEAVGKQDALLLTVLVGFTLFVRLYLLQMINVGPDEIDYWFSAKQLVSGGTYPEIMHRTIRWAIILPVAFFQMVLGMHPLVYYFTPILNSLIQTVLLYVFAKKLLRRDIAFYTVLLFTAWPYMWRTGSQIRPAIFSLTYVLVSLYTFFLFLEAGKRRNLLISAVFLFFAYQSKITNLYFLPGILVVLWLHRRWAGDLLLYAGSLFGLYVVEHLGYWYFTGNRMGRLGIIAAHHLTGDFAEALPGGFFGLFARYTDYMEFPWKLFFLVFLAATVYLLMRNKPWARELTILHGSFFFFLTFMVKSINPIEPVEPFLDRYYIVNLPTMSLMIVYALSDLKYAAFLFGNGKKAPLVPIALGAALLMLAMTALPMPSAVRRFYTPLAEISEHPIPKTLEFVETMQQAIAEDLPIISVDTAKPLDTANRVFYDDPETGREPLPIRLLEPKGPEGPAIYFLYGAGADLDIGNPEQRVLWCDRFNFDMSIMRLREIPPLSGLYSGL
jgi:hypothetical protein